MMGCLVVIGLIVVVLLVVLVFYMASASGSTGDDGDQTGTEVTQEQSTDVDEEALANPVDCLPGAVDVEIDLAGASYDAGVQVEVPVTVTNTGDMPCLADTGHNALEVEIHSGDDLIWASSQCPSGAAERALLLDVGASESRTISWDGNRGCDSDSVAQAGTYRVLATLNADGGQASAEQAFTLV